MRQVTKDSADIGVELYIIDSATGVPETGVVFNTSGIDLKYRREGAAAVSITEIDLTTPALTDAHEDGGFLAIGNGVYRLDVPDAAFATGAKTVTIFGTVTDMIVLPVTIQLVGYNTEVALATASAVATAQSDLDIITGADGVTINSTTQAQITAIEADTNELQTDDYPTSIAAVKSDTAATLVDTNELQADWTNNGRLDLILDAVLADTNELQADDTPTAVAAVQTTVDAIEAAVITNAAGVDIAADIIAIKAETAAIVADTNELQADDYPTSIAAVKSDTAAILTDTAVIGAAGAGLTAVPWNADWDAQVESEVTDALIALGLQHLVLQTTTIATLASQVSFTLTAGSADNDVYNGMVAVIEDVSTGVQRATGIISDYTGATKTVTLREDPAVFTMAATDKITILAVSKDLLAVLADTNELQTDWADGGRLDLILDAAGSAGDPWSTALPGAYGSGTAGKIVGDNINAPIGTVDTVVDGIQTDLSNATDGLGALKTLIDSVIAAVITNAAGVDISADIIAIKAETAAIVADTNELQGDWVNGGRLDLLIDAIKAITDLLTLAAINAQVDTALADYDGLVLADLGTPAGSNLLADVAAIKAETAAIVADTNELQVDNYPASIAAVQTAVDAVNTDLSNATDGLGALKTLIDTVNTDLSNGTDGLGALKSLIDTANTALVAIQAITDLLTLANINTQVDGAFTTIMADSVPADGVIPTREQALYMINQFLTDFAIVGTTRTTRKVNGSTALMTHTLDHATSPTALTRAT